MSYDPRYPTHHQESEQELLLSIQNTLDDICLNQTYSVTYGQYTPQGLLDKGRELGAKLIEYVKRFFKWLYEKTFGRQKQINESKEKMQKASENLSKAKQEKDHNPHPQPPEPQNHDTSNHTPHPEPQPQPPTPKPKPRIIRDMTPEEYHKLLMQHGYTVDEGKYDPLKIYQEAISVIEAVGRFHQRMLKGLTFISKSSKYDMVGGLSNRVKDVTDSSWFIHGRDGKYFGGNDFPPMFTDFYGLHHSNRTDDDLEHRPTTKADTNPSDFGNGNVYYFALPQYALLRYKEFESINRFNNGTSIPKAFALKELRDKFIGGPNEARFHVPTIENWISVTKEASNKLGQLASMFSGLEKDLANLNKEMEAFLQPFSRTYSKEKTDITPTAIKEFLRQISTAQTQLVGPVQEVVVETNKLLFAVERHYTHGVEDTDHTDH